MTKRCALWAACPARDIQPARGEATLINALTVKLARQLSASASRRTIRALTAIETRAPVLGDNFGIWWNTKI